MAVAKTSYPTIPNAGAMSEFIGAFEVPSKVTDYRYQCHFSHCWNGIATRHSDTMDCKFLVDGKGVIARAGTSGFVAFREKRRAESDRSRSQLHRGGIFARAAGAGRRAFALRCLRCRCAADYREAGHFLSCSTANFPI